jgi:hypothetical protein
LVDVVDRPVPIIEIIGELRANFREAYVHLDTFWGQRMNRLWPILVLPLALGMSPKGTGTDVAVETVDRPATERIETARPPYLFAVIGQVAYPGVYRAPTSDPLLVDLIHNTGGLTDAASGYLRIVRRGPNGFQAIYASDAQFQLRPGDVVVAERVASQPMTSPAVPGFPSAANTAAMNRPPLPAFVQLVFVDLIDRPVVLKMPRSTATVAQILELLGQSSDLASTVKVIPPFHPSTPTPHSTQFKSPTVLVFDPTTLKTDRIPELPVAVVNDVSQPRQATDEVHSDSVFGSGNGAVNRLQLATAGTPKESADIGWPSSPAEGLPDSAVDEAASLLPLRTAGSRKSRNDVSSLETATTPLPLHPAVSKPIVSSGGEKAVVSGSSPLGRLLTGSLAVTLIAVAAGGIMIWLRRRKAARSHPPAVKSPSSLESNNLDEIINDELPVVEEPFEYPTHLRLSGRVIGPARIRVDAAERPPRPHFLPAAQPPQVRPPIPDPATKSENVEPPRRASEKIRFNVAKTTDAVGRPLTVKRQAATGQPSGLLDRVLSTVHGVTRK